MLRFLATLCGLLACLATASVAEAHKKRGHHHGKAQHSLRQPVTIADLEVLGAPLDVSVLPVEVEA